MEKIYHTNSHQKRAKLAIQMSDKIDLKKTLVIRAKGGHFKVMNESLSGRSNNYKDSCI